MLEEGPTTDGAVHQPGNDSQLVVSANLPIPPPKNIRERGSKKHSRKRRIRKSLRHGRFSQKHAGTKQARKLQRKANMDVAQSKFFFRGVICGSFLGATFSSFAIKLLVKKFHS